MGGSSGGGGGGSRLGTGFGSGGGSSDPCNIRSTTTLQSTKAVSLKSVKLDDEFAVELYPNSDSRTVACLSLDTGAMVGTISIGAQASLIQCLLAGVIYSAKVVLIEGGRCDVRIRRVNA